MLTLNPTDINSLIFQYINLKELYNLYFSNKNIKKDIDHYILQKYKKLFKQLLHENKCIHCFNLCDTVKFKVCDECTLDTCWFCYSKVGFLNLLLCSHFNVQDKRIDYVYKCVHKCDYKCNKCKRIYNKDDVCVNNSTITCIPCACL
uniref:F-box domain-containing protein n=1 Tax=viral metagenome TaxID=1070528 RepID=A0A6C0I5Q8_9ZZZZ